MKTKRSSPSSIVTMEGSYSLLNRNARRTLSEFRWPTDSENTRISSQNDEVGRPRSASARCMLNIMLICLTSSYDSIDHEKHSSQRHFLMSSQSPGSAEMSYRSMGRTADSGTAEDGSRFWPGSSSQNGLSRPSSASCRKIRFFFRCSTTEPSDDIKKSR